MKSSDFLLQKAHSLREWIHVVWAILCEDQLGWDRKKARKSRDAPI